MSSVDELCRSYLDLKYHFDPAAASSAGLVAQDARLGRFDAEPRCASTSRRSGRSPARSRSSTSTTCRTRSTGRRCSASSGAPSSGWSTSGPHERNPIFWVNHLFQGLYAVLSRQNGEAGGPCARGARAAPGDPGVSRRRARDAGRAAVGVRRFGARHARRRRRAGGAAGRRRSAREAPELQRRARAARPARRSRRSSDSAPRSATRSSPTPIRTPSPSARSSSPGGCTSSTRSWPARPSSGATASTCRRRPRASWSRWPRRAGPAALARDGGGAPGRRARPGELLDVYRQELERARAFLVERDLVAVPTAPVDVVATPSFLASLVPFAAYEPPPIFLGAQRGPVLRDAARPVAAARGRGAAAARVTAATASRRWWRTRPIRATTSSSSPRSSSRRRCAGISGRRSWSRAGRSTASSSWTRWATTRPRSSGCSSW